MGSTALSTSLELGGPLIITYGTRSPYWGSLLGSPTIRLAATVTPGGGGPLLLEQHRYNGKNQRCFCLPVSSHSYFFCENEILNWCLVVQKLCPRSETIVLNLTEILGTKKNSRIDQPDEPTRKKLLTSSNFQSSFAAHRRHRGVQFLCLSRQKLRCSHQYVRIWNQRIAF